MIRPIRIAAAVAGSYNPCIGPSTATFDTEPLSAGQMLSRQGSDRRALSRACIPLGGRRASRLRLCPSLERESSLSLYPRNDDLPRTPVRRTRRRPSLIVAPGRRLPQGRLPLAHRLYHPKQCGQRNASPQGGFPPCLPVCPGGDKFGRWIDVADYQLLLVE